MSRKSSKVANNDGSKRGSAKDIELSDVKGSINPLKKPAGHKGKVPSSTLTDIDDEDTREPNCIEKRIEENKLYMWLNEPTFSATSADVTGPDNDDAEERIMMNSFSFGKSFLNRYDHFSYILHAEWGAW